MEGVSSAAHLNATMTKKVEDLESHAYAFIHTDNAKERIEENLWRFHAV
jgi:hypothetical protein